MVSLSIERSKQHDHDNKKETTGNNPINTENASSEPSQCQTNPAKDIKKEHFLQKLQTLCGWLQTLFAGYSSELLAGSTSADVKKGLQNSKIKFQGSQLDIYDDHLCIYIMII